MAVLYPNNLWLFIWQKIYTCAKMFIYSHSAPVPFYAKPNPYLTLTKPQPKLNLSSSSAGAVPLPEEAAIVLTEMQVAAHAQA